MGFLDGKLSSVAVSVSTILPIIDALAVSVSALKPQLDLIMTSVTTFITDLEVPAQDSAANSLVADIAGNKTDTIDGDALYAFSVLLRDTLFPSDGIKMYPDAQGIHTISIPPSTTNWVTSNTFTTCIASGSIASPFVIDFAVIDFVYDSEAYQLDIYSGSSGSEVLIASVYWAADGVWQQAPIKTPIIPAGTRISAKFASSAPVTGYASYFKFGYHVL
jgi:hypothetical protein